MKLALRRELRGLLICLPLVVIFALVSWASFWLWALGFSEVLRDAIRRTTSAPPRKNCPAGPSPKARQSRFKSPQQRSSQAEMPVISELENCSPRSYRHFESPLLRQQVSDITAENFSDSIVPLLPTVSARGCPSWPLRERISCALHVQCRSFLRTRLCQWLSRRMMLTTAKAISLFKLAVPQSGRARAPLLRDASSAATAS